MLEITVPIVCTLNKCCLKEGENFNILDINRLESALGNQWAPYPTDEQAIASVYRSLVQNHAFENGNKRTAVLVMLRMSESINRKISLTHQDLIDLTYQLAKEGGSEISTTYIANKLFGMSLEESKNDVKLKWTIVKETPSGEYFWSEKDQDFTISFKNRNEASYIFSSADEARDFINKRWPFEVRKNMSAIILPYNFNETEIPDVEYHLVEDRQQTALKSNGIYSVMSGTWIKEPVAEDIPNIDMDKFNSEYLEWEKRVLDILKEKKNVTNESKREQDTYCYVGPLLRFGRSVLDEITLYTNAVSLKQAINNFKLKGKKRLGLAPSAKLDIREDNITLCSISDEPIEDNVESPARCERCGSRLDDSVTCPRCDQGEEELLTEEITNSKISAIDKFIEDVYELRKSSVANEGEYGIGNLIFKELRAKGYLDKLRDLKHALRSKDLSLESLSLNEAPDQFGLKTDDELELEKQEIHSKRKLYSNFVSKVSDRVKNLCSSANTYYNACAGTLLDYSSGGEVSETSRKFAGCAVKLQDLLVVDETSFFGLCFKFNYADECGKIVGVALAENVSYEARYAHPIFYTDGTAFKVDNEKRLKELNLESLLKLFEQLLDDFIQKYNELIESDLFKDIRGLVSPYETLSLNEEFNSRTLERIYAQSLKNDGGTFNIKTGLELSPEIRRNKYIIEYESKDWDTTLDKVSKQEVINTIKRMQIKGKNEAEAIGTWSSKDYNASSVGLNLLFVDYNEALSFAKSFGQKAMGHFKDTEDAEYEQINIEKIKRSK